MPELMAERDENTELTGSAADAPFGEELRREREMRDISIREISETTKISTRFLEAIESGDFASLPAPVFTRGFIREYASYLGLEPEDIVDRYMSMVARQEQQRENEEEEMRDRISGRLPLSPGSSVIKWIVIAIVALAILGAGVYYLSTSGKSEQEPAPAGEEMPAEPEEVQKESEPQPVPEADSIRMKLTATGDSWIDLQVDDEPPTDFTLQSGSSRTFEAKERIILRTVGNAGVVEVELNGVSAEPLGRERQVVRDVEFDLEKVNALLRKSQAPSSENGSE